MRVSLASCAADTAAFAHFSIHNAVTAELACPRRSCQAYRDIFTRRRWHAQGFAVLKTEHGTKITTFTGHIKTTAEVFCRHQVRPR